MAWRCDVESRVKFTSETPGSSGGMGVPLGAGDGLGLGDGDALGLGLGLGEGEGEGEGDGEGEGEGDGDGDGDGEGDGAGAPLHPPTMSEPSNVTAPDPATARPVTLAVVPRPMLTPEKMLPLNWLAAPSVAVLLTCQYTLQAFAAPPITTCEAPAVVSVSRVIWNTQTSAAPPVSVSVPTRFPVGMQ